MLRRTQNFNRTALRERMLKEPGHELRIENASGADIQVAFVDQTSAERFGQSGGVEFQEPFIHIASGFQSAGGRLGCVIGKTERFEKFDCAAVGNDKALEAELAAQDVGQQMTAAAAGLSVDVAVGAHDRKSARADRIAERAQLAVAEFDRSHVRRTVIVSALRTAVRDEMFQRRNGSLGGNALHHLLAENGRQIGIFGIIFLRA